MTRILLKLTVGLVMVLTAAAGLIRAQPYDDGSLRALLNPPLDCAPPCFMGIQPGKTTSGAAMRALQNHPWVGQSPVIMRSVYDRRTFIIQWMWSGEQPDVIDTRWQGTINVAQNLVQNIRVRTTIPLGNVWLALGDTDQGVALFSLDRPKHRNTTYIAVYSDISLLVRSPTSWRVARHEFWRTNVELESGNAESIAYFGAYPYPMPCHWVCRS